MTIKIKHIKNFTLVLSCVFFAGLNYYTYANTNDPRSAIDTKYICNESEDFDCDGLIASEEKLYGTNPENKDTDNDGYSDGVEIKSGYDPTIPAPDDKILVTSNSDTTSTQSESDNSLTEKFSQDLASFIASEEKQTITIDDINKFAELQSANLATNEELPEIDKTQIKILEQNYDSLSEEEQKEKKREDALAYFQQIAYLLESNAPTPILTTSQFLKFKEDFLSHLHDLSDINADLSYFSDLADRYEVFISEAEQLSVPESMVDLHIKFLRISKGVLALCDSPELNPSDPLGRIIILKKADSYLNLFANFMRNDLLNYINSIQ